MVRTIIFFAGFCVPLKLAKSRFVWNKAMWRAYDTKFLRSKTPLTRKGVVKELKRLEKLINCCEPPIVLAGHSLGAWWVANIALNCDVDVQKYVYLTPLSDLREYPNIFRASPSFDLFGQQVLSKDVGPHKNLIIYGEYDLITPPDHAIRLMDHFDGMNYSLNGGHLLQTNHINSLIYMKDWIEL